jgi:RNA polymerase sigma-70 factor (ECF subfamily)
MISVDEFNSIYNQHVNAVFRVSLRAVSRREIAEEITSEVFLTLFQSSDVVTREQLPAWLFTVAKRRAADYWRRWYLEQRWADTTLESEHEKNSFSQPEIPFTDLLARCTALKPVHRACLILRFVQGMTREEIASQIGISELQVKGHLQYGLKLLRDTMSVYGHNLPPSEELSANA